jgi:hypothetical protein
MEPFMTIQARIKAAVIKWLGPRYDAEGRMGRSNPDYVQEDEVDKLVALLMAELGHGD